MRGKFVVLALVGLLVVGVWLALAPNGKAAKSSFREWIPGGPK